jgi:hypothetical protein
MVIRDHLSAAQIIGASVGVYVVAHRLYRVFYDLRLHPLAHIPGPKLAAITYLYQTYYSLVGGSRFYIQVGKLHEQYGMSEPLTVLGMESNKLSTRTGRANYPR